MAQLLESADPGFRNPVEMEDLDSWMLSEMERAEAKDQVSFTQAWNARALAERGAVGPGDLAWLFESEDRLGIGGYGLLSGAYQALGLTREADTLYKRISNFITIGTQSLTIVDTYEKASYFSSGEVELALFLREATNRDETPELLLRFAGALDRNRHARRFTSRFDDFWLVNGFMGLLARESRSTSPGLTVSLGGETLIEESAQAGKSLSLRQGFRFTEPPLSGFESDAPLNLALSAQGDGQLYCRVCGYLRKKM